MIKIYQSIYKADGLKIKVEQNQNIMKALIHECHSGKVNNRKTRAQNQNQKREKIEKEEPQNQTWLVCTCFNAFCMQIPNMGIIVDKV